MATNPKLRAPPPIFDNLAHLVDTAPPQALLDERWDVGDADVATDFGIAARLLISYDGSTATFTAYRRELERLCQWCWRIERRSFLSLTRDDIDRYVRFALSPPRAWIGTANVARFVCLDGQRCPNPAWRPYVITEPKGRSEFSDERVAYVPSQAAVKALISPVSSFYGFLVEETLVTRNPVKLIRQKSKFVRQDQNAAVVRRLSTLQWEYVLETAEHLAAEHPDGHERTLFLLTALYAMYLRISELVADERSGPVMGDFRKDGDGHWWFHVTGKGNKSRTVSVSDALSRALKRYRRSLSLPALPLPGDTLPWVSKQRGKGPVTSSRHIRLIVQRCFDAAYERMREDGLEADAMELKTATCTGCGTQGFRKMSDTDPVSMSGTMQATRPWPLRIGMLKVIAVNGIDRQKESRSRTSKRHYIAVFQ